MENLLYIETRLRKSQLLEAAGAGANLFGFQVMRDWETKRALSQPQPGITQITSSPCSLARGG